MVRTKSAWLVTWGVLGDAAAVADEIAAVFPRQWSQDRVKVCVEWLYALSSSTVAELVRYAGRPSRNPYRAKTEGEWIWCGHHPWLEARIVTDLAVETGEDLFEAVSWVEPDRWRLDEDSGRVVRVAKGRRHSIVRRLRGSLSNEQIWDRLTGGFKPGWGPGEVPEQPY